MPNVEKENLVIASEIFHKLTHNYLTTKARVVHLWGIFLLFYFLIITKKVLLSESWHNESKHILNGQIKFSLSFVPYVLACSDKASNWLKRGKCLKFSGNFIFSVSFIFFLFCHVFFCHLHDHGLRNPHVSISETKCTLQWPSC